MSTGLRRGSFASDEINPLDVTEMLRPEVYLLWTMRTVQYSAVQCSAVPAGERGGESPLGEEWPLPRHQA
jgi:hypothetical protein